MNRGAELYDKMASRLRESRSRLVQFRVTPAEVADLEARARASGFRSIHTFARDAARGAAGLADTALATYYKERRDAVEAEIRDLKNEYAATVREAEDIARERETPGLGALARQRLEVRVLTLADRRDRIGRDITERERERDQYTRDEARIRAFLRRSPIPPEDNA